MATTQLLSTLCFLLLSLLSATARAAAFSGLHIPIPRHVNELARRAPGISPNLTTGWSHLGCYTDDVNSRALYQGAANSPSLTQNSCIAYCSQNGFPYAGVEYGTECYCGKLIAASAKKAQATDCNMACGGAADELCGAGSRLNIFHLDSDVIPSSGPAHNAGPKDWGFLGCYVDSVANRTLPFGGQSEGGYSKLTNALCTEACQKQGYKFAGTEYAGECFCGDTLSDSLLASDGFKGCNMVCNGNSSEYCGGPNRMDVFGYRMKSTIAPKWNSVGCVTDSVQSRTLRYGVAVLGGYTNMTVENCQNACEAGKYQLAGVEYGQECFCDDSYQGSGGPAPDGDAGCNMACKGDGSQLCGGPNRMNVYTFVGGDSTSTTTTTSATTTTTTATSITTTVSTTTSVSATTTVSTTTTTRTSTSPSTTTTVKTSTTPSTTTTLKTSSTSSTTSTVKTSTTPSTTNTTTTTVKTSTTLNSTTSTVKTSTTPSTTTTSRSSATSSSTTTITTTTTSRSSATSGSSSRTTTTTTTTIKASTTPSTTTTTVKTSSTLTTTTTTTTTRASTTSTTITTVSTTNTVKVTTTNSTTSTQSSLTSTSANVTTSVSDGASSTTSVLTTTTTTTTTTVSPTPTGRGNYVYRGCYVDNAYGGRILTQQPDNGPLTIESCIQTCARQNLTIAGMEYSAQCFCGNSMVNGGAIAKQDSDCAMTCSGNQNQICGGPDRMSIYSTGNFTSYAPPKAFNTTLPGNWTYRGCLADTPQPRVLPYQIDMNNDLSVTKCLNLCAKYGYSAASMEYGQQCFCGDDYNRVNSGARFLDSNQCNTPCPAQPEALCGGASAMNYYTNDGLYKWANATGDAAGAYQFLIGGVVIPLITTVGVNSKVMFLEKHGTGPANSTGAFELDVTKVNDFSAAWRTLHGVRTDIFCSAGLTLPDKAGRQINVGGWSADSLFGVRLYWPDGSPGTASQNDWEENVDDVHLQVGRWYPSAMQLVNGSILVIGGEDGSNGKAVPSVEVIPRPPGGPVLFMDWLNRTDPNNLYPFLCVLPSGDIAAFYYNEGIILSETTFQTIRTLPTIPGAVNNDLAGRTYPMEGTMMILPQSAPYTDPLGVLICGGSTPFQGVALDNCVTIQPEVPGANWTIERMPSKRVLTCMAALPDGTYLILNGARQGLAGFGLASDPNHEAVLYDPSKPLNQRMTRMATTTIDRMYHSEAILLPDGRVLVSGSDPEDNTHPQEYRVEVFVPPYLMGGLAGSRPAYTIADKDWAFGGSYTVQITSGSVSKFSLMGAVSSTHGHSMGQRTLIPAFSCSGNSCTITAPPNGHVTGGSGWFMLFALNANGTPSVAQWVRIGGDPAGLGNWPDTGDFTLPGV